MYLSYFGFADTPFSIAPNPDYLYLSPRHREALAHLSYGLLASGGFVLLTGEVGTGKTTVARKLMQDLPENTQLAMILNPALSAFELLQTICDELALDYSDTFSLKALTDTILNRLVQNHQIGINTVVMIDEAQHLQPEALEQLRLLTNLETNKEKLLKIVLIGQPELQQLLKRNELRQLAQRITARYHLMPLSKEEVAGYVSHRLQIAGGTSGVFEPRALASLYWLSGGIPRVINLLCDRCLMVCSLSANARVGLVTCLRAAEHVLGPEVLQAKRREVQTVPIVLLSVLAAVAGFFVGGML